MSESLKMGWKRVVGGAVWDKEGKYKYIVHLLREVRRELNALKVTQRGGERWKAPSLGVNRFYVQSLGQHKRRDISREQIKR